MQVHAHAIPASRARRGTARRLRALAVANLRYWPSVAPIARAELAHWRSPAERIDDPRLRLLALDKLAKERFNAEVAATLATLAPPGARAAATRAIVSLELLYDYLDGRTELPSSNPIEDSTRLYGAFTGALDADYDQPQQSGAASRTELAVQPEDLTLSPPADGQYLQALAARTREQLFSLSAAQQVSNVALKSAERCAEAQTMLHASATIGDRRLREWASERARGSGLEWREYVSGSAASVLAVHALIAAAADARTTAAQARRIDAAYMAIGAVITMLDSLVDHSVDTASGQAGVVRLYESREQFSQRLCVLIRVALARALEAPHGEHHATTLAGVVAYYTTHRGARERHARSTVMAVRRELSPTIWPTLAVMSAWRAAKSARAGGLRRRCDAPAPRPGDARQNGAVLE